MTNKPETAPAALADEALEQVSGGDFMVEDSHHVPGQRPPDVLLKGVLEPQPVRPATPDITREMFAGMVISAGIVKMPDFSTGKSEMDFCGDMLADYTKFTP